jgi:O-antigen ligase
VLYAIVIVYTILLFLRPQDFMPALLDKPILLYMLLVGAFLWLFGSKKHVEYPQYLLIPVLVVLYVVSRGLNGWWGGGVFSLELTLPPLLYMALIAQSVRSIARFRFYIAVLALCTALLVYHGYQQVTYGAGWTGEVLVKERIRYIGILNDPNDLGLLIVMSICLCGYLFSEWRNVVARIPLALLMGWLGYGLYLTESRGALLALLAVVGMIIWRRMGKVSVGVLAGLLLPTLVAATRLSTISTEEESAEGRLDAWYLAIELFQSNPIFGVGLHNFIEYNRVTAHNSIVLPLAELGITGFMVWLGIVAASGYMAFKLGFTTQVVEGVDPKLRERQETEIRAGRALAWTMFGFAVGAFFLSQSYKFMLFILCGLAMARYAAASEVLALPAITIRENWKRLLLLGIGSIIFMWLFTKILLQAF